MTSQEIREQFDISPRNEAALWEIAYQLATMNEQYGKTVIPTTGVILSAYPNENGPSPFVAEDQRSEEAAAVLRSCEQTIRENKMSGPGAASYLRAYANTISKTKELEPKDAEWVGGSTWWPRRQQVEPLAAADHAPETAVRAKANDQDVMAERRVHIATIDRLMGELDAATKILQERIRTLTLKVGQGERGT